MSTQIETRLRKLEASRPESPREQFSVAELKQAREELTSDTPEQPMSPLLQTVRAALEVHR